MKQYWINNTSNILDEALLFKNDLPGIFNESKTENEILKEKPVYKFHALKTIFLPLIDFYPTIETSILSHLGVESYFFQ